MYVLIHAYIHSFVYLFIDVLIYWCIGMCDLKITHRSPWKWTCRRGCRCYPLEFWLWMTLPKHQQQQSITNGDSHFYQPLSKNLTSSNRSSIRLHRNFLLKEVTLMVKDITIHAYLWGKKLHSHPPETGRNGSLIPRSLQWVSSLTGWGREHWRQPLTTTIKLLVASRPCLMLYHFCRRRNDLTWWSNMIQHCTVTWIMIFYHFYWWHGGFLFMA